MTKIKNTKKGMAKKTLSMSLVVAMLATSNVPVWAAEFSDGSDVAVATEAPAEFTDETEAAPVVEDAAEEVSTAQANENYTVKTNLSLKKVDWNTGLTLVAPEGKTAEFTIENKDGVVESWAKAEVYAGNGGLLTTVDTTTNSSLVKALETVKYGLNSYKADRNVTVKVYVANDTNPVCEFNSVIQPVDISKWTITSGKTTSKTYNGTVQNPDVTITAPSGSSFQVGGSTSEVTIQYADVTEAKNVGSYDYNIVGVESEGYTGKTTENGKFEITPAKPDATNLAVTVSGTVAYNGDVKSLVKVTDKYTGEVLPSDLYTVAVSKTDAGKYDKSNITSVKLVNKATINNKTVNNNFGETGKTEYDVTSLLSGDYTVTAFDLSKLSEKYTVNVATKKANENVATTDITFTDKATGKTYTYAQVIPGNDVDLKTTNNNAPGNGTITITPKTNVTGTFTTTFTVVNNVVTAADVAFPVGFDFKDGAKPSTVKLALNDTRVSTYINSKLTGLVYNGTAQEPLKEAFSNLVLSNSATTSDVKLVLGTDYDLVYSNNTDSDTVKGVTKTDKSKIAKVTFVFKGNYTGTFSYEFNIAKAQATITGNNVSYVAGKNSYDASVSVKTADKKDVPASEYTVTTTKKGTKVGDTAEATVVFNNKNYDITNTGKATNTTGYDYLEGVVSNIVGKDLKNCTATIEGNYVYTGESISPKLTVKDGDIVLVEGKDYKVSSKNNINAGKALVTITAVTGSNYTGSLTLEYEIKKANLADAKVTLKTKGEYSYTGVIVTPTIDSVTIGSVPLTVYDPIEKKGDYTFTYDEAVEAGTYNFTLKALDGSKNVEGEYKGTFKVTPHELTACFTEKLNPSYVDYNAKNPDGTYVNPPLTLETDVTGAYYTGKAITIDSFKKKYVVVDKDGKVLTEGKDYRLEYTNNVDAGKASVVAYGIGNHATTDKDGKPVAIASMNFYIGEKGTITSAQIKKIANVEYAGGLPVEPEVVVYDAKGNRLVQGTDYTVEAVKNNAPITEIGNYKKDDVIVKGKGAYVTGNKDNGGISASATLDWKVTKKDLANTAVSVDKEGNVTILNGTVIVPATEYDVKFSDDKKKVTVTAKANSTKYTGSKEITVESAKVGQAMIANVVVKGNTVTPVLSSEVEEAVGYDYVIATEEDYKNGRVGVSKNILKTNTDFHYVQQGTYYAYCHAWKRNAEGKKVFGEWSNIVKFTVTATTPSTPTVKSVKVKGNTVTVTYTVSKDATGYDVILGSAVKTVNGEKRPVDYGTLVKKNIKGNVVTATFTNVPAGKYYAGVHSFNRTSENGSKVFSKWSNSRAVTVK